MKKRLDEEMIVVLNNNEVAFIENKYDIKIEKGGIYIFSTKENKNCVIKYLDDFVVMMWENIYNALARK